MNKTVEGRVIKSFGKLYTVMYNNKQYECMLRGKHRIINKKQHNPVVIGDIVEFTLIDEKSGIIESIIPRKNKIHRTSKRGLDKEQILFANVDQLIIFNAITNPKPLINFIDRITILAEYENITPVIVFNKIDLLDDMKSIEQLKKIYANTNYKIMFISLKTGEGLKELSKLLKGKFTALVGQSGVGKSTLINNLIPNTSIKVQSVSNKIQRGRHTTTNYSLYILPNGGFIADAPGINTMPLYFIDYRNLDTLFADFLPFITSCSFSNCSHIDETGCEIIANVGTAIHESRYTNYKKLYNELKKKQKRNPTIIKKSKRG